MTAGNPDNSRNIIKYTGQNYTFTPAYMRSRDPTTNDIRDPKNQGYYPFTALWINKTNQNLWSLVRIANNLATWILLSSGGVGPLLSVSVPNGVSPIVPDGLGNMTFTSNAGTITITGSAAVPNNHTINFDLAGGGVAIDQIGVDAATAPGTNPVVPTAAGQIDIRGGTTFATGTLATPIRTNSLQANRLDLQSQLSGSNPAVSTANNFGVSQADSNQFNVTNGFWQLKGGTGPALLTLSDDVNTIINPSASGNIQLVGHVVEQGATKFSTIVAGTNLANINPMSSARWIVDSLGFNGTHTTIASAITSATSGDTIFVLPGTYTENLTLKAGVNIVANPGDEYLPNVTIVGKCTFTATGTVNISNIRLQTNSDFFLAVTGANASIVNLENCYLNCANNTGISFTVTNTSSQISLTNCEGNVGTTGIALFAFSGTGVMQFDYCNFTNTGATLTNSTCSAGTLFVAWTEFNIPIAVSGVAGAIEAKFSFFNVGTTTPLTLTNTTSTNTFESCSIGGGTNSAVSIGAGCTTGIFNSGINSQNTNALTGAGTLQAPSNTFTGTSFANNVTTITPFPFGLTGTFTPTLRFGGASVGITYGTRLGKYWLIGEMVFIDIVVVLTNKGVSVGAATVAGLPFTSANDSHGPILSIFPLFNAFPAGTTVFTANVNSNSTVIALTSYGAGALGAVSDVEFTNTSQFNITGFYWCA